MRRFGILIFVGLLALISVIDVYAAEWYNTDWKYRQKITISGSMAPSDLANFPVLVKLTSTTNSLFSQAQASGNDILFTSEDGTTKLSHEIEKYTNSSKELWAWVKIPTLRGGSPTVVYMYYGNAACASQQDAANVWDSNFKGVWHLKETGTNPQVNDSTSNANNSTANYANPTTSGEIDGAQQFTNANSDYITTGDSATLSFTSGGMTISGWVKPNALNKLKVVDKYQNPFEYVFGNFDDNSNLYGWVYDNDSNGYVGRYVASTSSYISTGTWAYLVMTYSGGTTAAAVKIYIDSVQRDSNDFSAAGFAQMRNTTSPFNIGRTHGGLGPNYMDGTIDEVRISNSARSAAWITTEYNNQSSPGTYITFGAQSYNGEPGKVTDAVTESPIKDATVTLYTASGSIYTGRAQPNPTQTDANGYYTLEADPGRYYLTATKEGYEDFKSGLFTVSSPVSEPITMIPLDQSKGKIFNIVNQVDKKVATIGDVLTYKITVQNLTTSDASSVSVAAKLPHDFRLVKGTCKVNGVPSNDPTSLKNPSFGLNDLASNITKTITYRVIVGPDAKIGKNKVFADIRGTISGQVHTQGPAVATVDVREGVFSELGMLVGKVYYDENRNGVQDGVINPKSKIQILPNKSQIPILPKDYAEPGIPGIAVILDDGTTVITDEYGRYSIPQVSPGLHAVRLDQRVLPGGPLYKSTVHSPPSTEHEPLIERRSLGAWVSSRLGTNGREIREDKEKEGKNKDIEGLKRIDKDKEGAPRRNDDGIRYRTDIPQVSRFVNIPETATGKLDFPIQLLTTKEEELLKKQHEKETQFLAIGTFDGTLGDMHIKGNRQNFKDGNLPEVGGNEFPDNIYQDGRVILYLKGLIKGKYLLTTRFDSTKNNQDHLYKYINPERYYPVYGDNSILTNDADSQGKLFVKLERESSYAELGNYSTEEFEATQLARYNRVLHGVKAHFRTEDFEATNRSLTSEESQPSAAPPRRSLTNEPPRNDGVAAPRFHATTFVANTSQEETEDTFSANGISGPFYLTKTPILEYTERIRIETRDRTKSDTILKTTYLVRDADYSIEYDNGRIYFKAPIPSRDENGDPTYIVVRYEYSANTELEYDIMGNRLEVYLFPRIPSTNPKSQYYQIQNKSQIPNPKQIQNPNTTNTTKQIPNYQLMLAAQTINEQKDLYNWGMYSADAIFHLTPNIRFMAEYARSLKTNSEYGQAGRVEGSANLFKDKLKLQGYIAEIDPDFYNPFNVTESGVQKYGASAYAYLTDNLSVIGDHWFSRSMGAHTYDRKTSVDGIWQSDRLFLSSGFRFKEYVAQKNEVRDTQTFGMESSQGFRLHKNLILSNTANYEIETEHDFPSSQRIDLERDIFTLSPRIDILMNDDISLYARHDFTTNFFYYNETNIYDSNTTTVGLSRIRDDGVRSYVEYGFTGEGANTIAIGQEADTPITDRMSLRSYMSTKVAPYHTTENIGYNSRVRIFDNFYGNFAFERNKVADGNTHSDYNSQSVALEYITKDTNIGSKFEHRDENAVNRYNLFGNAQVNLADNTRIIGKGEYSWKRDKDNDELEEDYKRLMTGIAYRPTSSNDLNFFGKYEYKENLYRDSIIPLDTHTHTGSFESIYEPFKFLNLSGKYAVKYYNEREDNLSTHSLTDMITIRPTLQLTDQLDLTYIYRYLRNIDIKTMKQLTSVEAGLTLYDHLRLAAGYNFTRYDDKYLPDEDYQGYGPYVRLTYKFLDDAEKLLESREEMLARFADESALELYEISQIPGDEKFVEELRTCYSQAMKWYRFGKYEEALECLHQGMEAYYAALRYANNLEAKKEEFSFHLKQAKRYYEHGLKDKAFLSLEKAYAINAYDKELLILMSRIRNELKCEKAKRREILKHKLEGIEKLGKLKDEEALALEAVKLNLQTGLEFYSIGDYESAIKEWGEGLNVARRARSDYFEMEEERKLMLKELDSIYNMALLYCERKDYPRAKNELEHGLELVGKTLE